MMIRQSLDARVNLCAGGGENTDPKQGQMQGEETPDTRAPRRKSMLDTGHDWELRVHLDSKLVFPNFV